MEVRMTGKALANGAAGDIIKIENLSSKQQLEGTVTARGEIQINL
jgi:flagella basal body P-ring formation protein FlgA